MASFNEYSIGKFGLCLNRNKDLLTRLFLANEPVYYSQVIEDDAYKNCDINELIDLHIVNTLETIPYTLNGQQGLLPLIKGSYLFVSDYDSFKIDDDIIIMYVENFTTFKQISRYTYLFKPGKYLFVSRLLSSIAFPTWLKSIPNKYIHFGDFDLAGIDIYLHFFNDISDRASFLIPEDIEERIKTSGNSSLYYTHEEQYKEMNVTDRRVQSLVDMIHKYHMGYEQEGYAK